MTKFQINRRSLIKSGAAIGAGLALPTILLYEVSIFAARMIERKRAQRQRESEAQADS